MFTPEKDETHKAIVNLTTSLLIVCWPTDFMSLGHQLRQLRMHPRLECGTNLRRGRVEEQAVLRWQSRVD
jgi:hypothetical protein